MARASLPYYFAQYFQILFFWPLLEFYTQNHVYTTRLFIVFKASIPGEARAGAGSRHPVVAAAEVDTRFAGIKSGAHISARGSSR